MVAASVVAFAAYYVIGVIALIIDLTRYDDMTAGDLIFIILLAWIGWPCIVIEMFLKGKDNKPRILMKKRK